ncbi:ninein isoform X1 [Molossus molossus]|uniref:Ninein n=1 Tax=Molossus molossus TaxID=27622 RepID=A0A7J8JXN0_MOLMO|nr:ninein isoform X1 [Molossus molossus]XP_036124349.1 ninein isoform X1 [Molossus molossus]XP_036124357.1 ninein isoform X1 [Molossus molossus]XP_036124365.1 ninein isoform X1 [Molossus molossus]XP_036124370.1 ninein isoform X1 [Molossus molossus]XP_036124379.1 ninein isoform X1 [Molossus molossus]KAF6501597.1 ninein [Molossus molossus]
MDEVEQDQHEARLKELFDSFDTTGTGSLGQEELTDLCHMLSLEEVAPVLQETLLQDNLLGRVHFDQFKEALILILSRTLSNEEHFQEPDCSLEAQPKYVRGGKRYGRRSLPEFQESVEEFAEVTVIEPLEEEASPSHIPASDRRENWKTQRSEEYEAEGQLRFWNPDDLNASHSGTSPPQDWIEEKLQEVCEDLGITRDGHLNRKKLVSICEQYGLQNVDGEMLEEVFHNLDPDGTMSVEDFFYGLFRNGKSLTPSASTPYRQLKRHLSMQSFDESGRRNTTPSAMTSTIGFRVFSCLDDGMGYAPVERILDTWQEEGIENSPEILKALEFSLDGNVNLTELTLALENELLVTKNSVHQAALASFKAEIRHLLERVDQVVREKEKLRSDLDKAEKLKSLMASEVDDHHAAIERRNEHNLRKLDEEYKERIAALKNELRQEREQIMQQVGKQRLELEQEIEKAKTEENYIRDRLALSLKENSRLENELLENAEKLAEYENLTNKLQRNLENVLAEKFGDLDPGSAEFFLQEERLTQMRNEYEQQCRVLQDQVDELQSELEEYRTQGKVFRLPLKNSLSEELDASSGCLEPVQGLGSEECNPLNMSIEAELVIEQMKEHHQRDLCHLRLELEDKVRCYEKQLETAKAACEKEQELMKQEHEKEVHILEKQISDLKNEIAELQGQAVVLQEAQRMTNCRHEEEKKQLQKQWDEEKTLLQEKLRLEHETELKDRLEQVEESFSREREGLLQNGAWTEEKVRDLTQELEKFHLEQLKSLVVKYTFEKEELRKELLEKYQRELQEGREKMETECNRRTYQIEAQFQADCQKATERCENVLQSLERHYRQELKELLEQHLEEKSQWQFEKDELTQECAEAQEQLKETLQREKATSLVLTQEREMLEKTYKEHLNSMVAEREQLLKDLEDLRNVSENQQSLLSNQILELKSSHERELKDREQVLSQAGISEQLTSQRLERLEREHEQERQEMMSKLLAMENIHKVTCEKADRDRAEMSTEISQLQNKIKEMQQVASPPSRLPNGYQEMGEEEADGSGAMSLLQQGEQLLEENGDVLLSLQRAHEQAVKENVKMATEISRLQQRLQKLEPGSVMPSCLEEPTTGFFGNSMEQTEPFLLQSRVKQVEGVTRRRVLSDLQEDEVRDLGSTGTSSVQRQEVKIEESEASIESFSELENSEEIRTETWDLKNQICQLQEQLMILRADCDRASEKKRDLLFDVSVLKKKLNMLERIPEASPKYKLLYEDASRENDCLQEELRVLETHYDEALENNKELTSEVFRLQDELKKVEEATETFLGLEKSYDEVKRENEELHGMVLRLQGKIEKLQGRAARPHDCFPPWGARLENLDGEPREKALDPQQTLEEHAPKVMNVHQITEHYQENQYLERENTQTLEKVKAHKIAWLHRTIRTHGEKPGEQNLVILEENTAVLGLQDKHFQRQAVIAELELEKKKLQELTRKLRERVTNLVKQKDVPSQGGKEEELKAMMHDLQITCSEMQQKVELLRYESEKLQEENSILRNEITTLNEEDSVSNLQLEKLNGSQEEMWQNIETVKQEKATVQEMVEILKKQISELKTKNQQLDMENTELSQKNSQNQKELQELNQRLAEVLCQEQQPGPSTSEEWEEEKSNLKEELEHCKVQSSTLVSSLEAELSEVKIQMHIVEQENLLLKDELEKMQQLHRCPDLSDFQQKISSVLSYNEKLLKEKEALSEELNSCADKLAKSSLLEHRIATMKQEQKSWEHQSESLKLQLAASQERVQSLEDTLQNVNLQMSRIKSDLRVTQQEKEALKQEVMSLHKQLQNAGDKNWAPEAATHPSGFHSQQQRLSWDKLDHLRNEEQQLLWQENERLQTVVQNTKAELTHSREKVRQLESNLLTPKHQKHVNSSGTVKPTEQEKLSLKRECEQFQKEKSPTNRKVSQMNSLERELETIHLETEGLKKKQVKLDEQLMEMQHLRSTGMLSPSPHAWDLQLLQQQACPMVPREQFLQLQHQLLQAERINQRLQEESENRTSETNTPQGNQEQLVTVMEERMMEVEQKLKLVKRLLQEKVDQLKEQLCKNTKADAMVKDLYVENAQLLKALEVTEQRQKTAEKKNYLLEEKIASLSNIVRNLTPAPLTYTPPLRS